MTFFAVLVMFIISFHFLSFILNSDFVLLNFRTDCFCNEFFSFCARDIEGLEENEIPKLPNSCLISNEKEEDTTTVTSKPDETTKVTSEKANTKTLDDKSFSNSSSNDKKLNKHD